MNNRHETIQGVIQKNRFLIGSLRARSVVRAGREQNKAAEVSTISDDRL
jgi:hypothetical protein